MVGPLIWKICWSNWIISPGLGVKITNTCPLLSAWRCAKDDRESTAFNRDYHALTGISPFGKPGRSQPWYKLDEESGDFASYFFEVMQIPCFAKAATCDEGHTPSWKKASPKKGCFFLHGGLGSFFDKGVELWKWHRMPPILLIVHRKNGGTLGMVPLIINPIYTLSSGYLLGPSPHLKGSNTVG